MRVVCLREWRFYEGGRAWSMLVKGSVVLDYSRVRVVVFVFLW